MDMYILNLGKIPLFFDSEKSKDFKIDKVFLHELMFFAYEFNE